MNDASFCNFQLFLSTFENLQVQSYPSSVGGHRLVASMGHRLHRAFSSRRFRQRRPPATRRFPSRRRRLPHRLHRHHARHRHPSSLLGDRTRTVLRAGGSQAVEICAAV